MNQPAYFEHFRNPRNCGVIERPDAVGQAGAADGDVVKVYLALEGDRLRATFQAKGCPAAIASASAATVLADGRTLDQAAVVSANMVEAELGGLPPEKRGCSNIGAEALANALGNLMAGRAELPVSRNGRRVAMAMSGGVDSSTALALLQRAGEDVVGITARHYDVNGTATGRSCCTPSDLADARRVAHGLSLPHFTVDLRDSFSAEVVGRFADGYLNGRTPNPCIDCNRRVRFGPLWDLARRIGATHLATGHYVKIDVDNDRYLVRRAVDRAKDQSYVIWWMTQALLARFVAPLGELTKSETRQIAGNVGLAVADKLESQDICFIPRGDYRRFLIEKAGYKPEPGPIVDISGRVLGEHSGLAFYTVGQRRGLRLSGPDAVYVVRLVPETNTLVVGSGGEPAAKEFTVSEVNFIPFDAPDGPLNVEVMTRYNMKPVPAIVTPGADGLATVAFTGEGAPVSPGQSAAFYDGDLLIGGGIIELTD